MLRRLTEWGRKQWLTAALIATAAFLMLVILTVSLSLSGGSGEPSPTAPPITTTAPVQTQSPATTTTAPPATTSPPVTTVPPATAQPPATTAPSVQPPAEDPETPNQGGASNTVPKDETETDQITFGIDVSKYQGVIDWEQVAQAGVDFAMIRVGYRTLVDGKIVADSNGKYNMQEAQKYGIRIGVYFFSTAVSEAEAGEEAAWVADQIAQYSITYPVAYNCEGFSDPENRQNGLTKSQRTDIALTFLKAIQDAGYTPMFYASRSELQGQAQWETSRIESQYKIWVAQYPASAYPQTEKSDYTGVHAMWQYTANGTVPGISGSVDMNIAYFGYDEPETPADPSAPGVEKPDWDAQMNFREVRETVTAKDETNLRDIPSQGEDSRILYTLKNGETATRIAVSDYGWSKLEFNGNVYYAVSSLLTTDLTPPGPEIQTPFTPVNEQVTAKDVVNLRTLPSVEHVDSQVVAQLKNGEYITRTGINTDVGWSRVEYNGQVLYCVSNFLMTEEEETQPAE